MGAELRGSERGLCVCSSSRRHVHVAFERRLPGGRVLLPREEAQQVSVPGGRRLSLCASAGHLLRIQLKELSSRRASCFCFSFWGGCSRFRWLPAIKTTLPVPAGHPRYFEAQAGRRLKFLIKSLIVTCRLCKFILISFILTLVTD